MVKLLLTIGALAAFFFALWLESRPPEELRKKYRVLKY